MKIKSTLHLDVRLRQEQLGDGSFPDMQGKPSIAHTAMILLCLDQLDDNRQRIAIKEKAARYLLSQRDEHWHFTPFAALDFLVLAALVSCNNGLVDGNAISHILITLGGLEAEEGGPYYSLYGQKKGNIDLGTNAMVAFFLSFLDVSLPHLDRLVQQAVVSGAICSSYFGRSFIGFILSHWYDGAQKGLLARDLGQAPDGRTILERSWDRCAIVNAGVGLSGNEWPLQPDDQAVLTELEKNHPLMTLDGEKVLSTPALNAAFYALALKRSADATMVKPVPARDGRTEKEEHMLARILQAAEERFLSLDEDMKDSAMREIRKTINGNKDLQMSLMAYFLREALGKKGTIFSDDTIARMGLANVFFWTAFIIYDNFWDEDEDADPRLLPVANLFARESASMFASIMPPETGYPDFFRQLMDRLDAANAWETTWCRMDIDGRMVTVPEAIPDYGDYERKYEPASAHILGPVIMLCQQGYALDSRETTNLISYFRHYLIPKQINDDLHDWKEDLGRGHISTAVAMLLEDLGAEGRTLDLETDMAELQQVFWFKTLPRAGTIVSEHIKKAKHALREMRSLENRSPLEQFIALEEKVIMDALQQQRTTADLLAGLSEPEQIYS